MILLKFLFQHASFQSGIDTKFWNVIICYKIYCFLRLSCFKRFTLYSELELTEELRARRATEDLDYLRINTIQNQTP